MYYLVNKKIIKNIDKLHKCGKILIKKEKYIIKAVSDGYQGEMILDKNLDGTIYLNSNEEYSIKINELDYNNDDIDVQIYNDEEIMELYTDSDELISDEYSGQVAVGVTYYAVNAIITDVQKNSKYYYKAYRRLNTVFINPVAISAKQASNRIKVGADTYTSSLAKKNVVATGLGVTKSENHWAWYKIGSYFNHYV